MTGMTKNLAVLAVSACAILSGCFDMGGWDEPIAPGFDGSWAGTSALTIDAENVTPQVMGASVDVVVDGQFLNVYGVCDAGPIQTPGAGEVVLWRGEKVCNYGTPAVPVTLTWGYFELANGAFHARLTGTTPNPDQNVGGVVRVELEFESN